MKIKACLFCAVAFLTSSTVLAVAEVNRFVQRLRLSATQTAVVAEGDLEARSLGSYSVRVYSTEDVQPGDDTTFFTAGVIRERDGFIERTALVDINRDGRDELVVIIRSAGSGSYLSAHAFSFGKTKITLAAAVADLSPHSDPIVELRKIKKKRK